MVYQKYFILQENVKVLTIFIFVKYVNLVFSVAELVLEAHNFDFLLYSIIYFQFEAISMRIRNLQHCSF